MPAPPGTNKHHGQPSPLDRRHQAWRTAGARLGRQPPGALPRPGGRSRGPGLGLPSRRPAQRVVVAGRARSRNARRQPAGCAGRLRRAGPRAGRRARRDRPHRRELRRLPGRVRERPAPGALARAAGAGAVPRPGLVETQGGSRQGRPGRLPLAPAAPRGQPRPGGLRRLPGRRDADRIGQRRHGAAPRHRELCGRLRARALAAHANAGGRGSRALASRLARGLPPQPVRLAGAAPHRAERGRGRRAAMARRSWKGEDRGISNPRTRTETWPTNSPTRTTARSR
jgi:hypothetical protein